MGINLAWLSELGLGSTTSWLGNKKDSNGERPRINTVNIESKKYVRAEAIREF